MVLGAAMLWGTTGTAQSLAPGGVPPVWVGALRLAVAAGFFAVLLLAQRLRAGAPWRAPTPRQWAALAAVGACMAAYNLAFFAGVRAAGVAAGTVVAIGSGPVWAGLLQWALQGRAPVLRWWLGTALAVAGGAAVATAAPGAQDGLAADPAGLVLCLLAGLSYAVYVLLNKRLVTELPAGFVAGAGFGVAALLAVPLAVAAGGRFAARPLDWAVVAYLGIAATGVAYLLFSHALRRISGATGVALALGEPVTAFVLAVTVVGEPATAQGVGGLALVLAGLAVVIAAELGGRPGESGGAATPRRMEARRPAG